MTHRLLTMCHTDPGFLSCPGFLFRFPDVATRVLELDAASDSRGFAVTLRRNALDRSTKHTVPARTSSAED